MFLAKRSYLSYARPLRRVPSRLFTSQLIDTRERILAFTRKHSVKLVVMGVGGGTILGYFCYDYLISKNPGSLERWMAGSANKAFAKALNFESRSDIYFRLPEYSLPIHLFVPVTDLGMSSPALLAEWAKQVQAAMSLASSSFLIQTKLSMRESLLEEVLRLPDLEARLAGIRRLFPPSLERNTLTDIELAKEQWVATNIFGEGQWQDPAETCDMRAKFLIAIISKFPGPLNQLALLLQEDVLPDDPETGPVIHSEVGKFAQSLSRGDPNLEATLTRAVGFISSQYHSLLPPVREHVLQHAFEDAITYCLSTQKKLPSPLLSPSFPSSSSPSLPPPLTPTELASAPMSTTLSSSAAPLSSSFPPHPTSASAQSANDHTLSPSSSSSSALAINSPSSSPPSVSFAPSCFSGLTITIPDTLETSISSSQIGPRSSQESNSSNQNHFLRIEQTTPTLSSSFVTSVSATTTAAVDSSNHVSPSSLPMNPYELYLVTLDDYLLGPLSKDTRIPRDVLQQVKQVFLALPPPSQARVLLRATLHPFAGSLVPREQASLVKDLMASGGIVAIKLAQMLSENPAVPKDYRELFGSLRAGNVSMSLGAFWNRVPTTLRARISHLGPRLGTGSVKQVHKAKWLNLDGSSEEVAVGVLRSNVEDEALSSIDALGKSPEIAQLASRLGFLVYRELDLFTEGQTLKEFADTNIGKHPLFHVVDVIHHSPKCLVEEVADGRTLAAILDSQHTREAEYEETTKLLAEYHRVVFRAFVQDGLIHSDIHLGNACKSTMITDKGDRKAGLVLFDIGQFERITLPETTALLWTLATMSTVPRRSQLRGICLKHLENVSRVATTNLTPDSPRHAPTPTHKPHDKHELENLLSRSFDEAIAAVPVMQPDGSITEELPDKKQAYLNFLRACEFNGVVLPKGCFALAKMMDAMTSQQEAFELPAVVDESSERFLRQGITWREKLTILTSGRL